MTISDKKLGRVSNLVQTKAEYYEAIVKTASDYYPFGWQMPNRKLNAENYSFGFNGQVQDAEWMGGQSVAFEFRTQDARLGRFLSTDPLTATTPWQTPYAFADNSPILKIDFLGLKGTDPPGGKGNKSGFFKKLWRGLFGPTIKKAKRFGEGTDANPTQADANGDMPGGNVLADSDGLITVKAEPKTAKGKAILFGKRNPNLVNRPTGEITQSHLTESTAYQWSTGNIGQQIVYGIANDAYIGVQGFYTRTPITLVGTADVSQGDRAAAMVEVVMSPLTASVKAVAGAKVAIKVSTSQSVQKNVIKQVVTKAGCFVGGTVVLTVDSLIAIDSLEVGMLVAVSLEHAEDPLFHDLLASKELFEQLKELPIVPKEWRKLELELSKPNGDKTLIELLRPQSWIAENLQKDSTAVYVSLPEMGSVGYAKVLSIDTCVIELADSGSSYRSITGKFIHNSNMVWELTFEGMSKPLGVTSNHPIWSYDRERWVEAGELKIGELVTTQGEPVRLLSKEYLVGEHTVYNIEVHGAHNYFVGEEGALVHNTGICPTGEQLHRALRTSLSKRGDLGFSKGSRYSQVGYALSKHIGSNRSHPEFWSQFLDPIMSRNISNFDQAGKAALRHILDNGGDWIFTRNQYGQGFYRKRLDSGRGVQFNENWEFVGFID